MYTIFVLYQALPAWLSLSRSQREAFFDRKTTPLFARFEQEVQVRLFDAEAFHARFSDVMMISCNDLNQYYVFMEALRDTELFSKPYIEVKEVIVTRENGFKPFGKVGG
ncbi:hypothetical protein F5984_11510 [Rudanella paleaurantiibacter]|uniref:Darcynin 1 n=1 Tax=Rudanella paleaurantiibacter TaxID=2614655 RepID=A0A7J5U1J0_9BACT|nr:darcynin family protein [Rudanella paleaurantiibacter]KAB7731411.1 hypothetical protein F5984_11510 [Rudanella paleaurantiibacter]